MNIQEIRGKYPQYSDMSDEQLASAIHQKYYADLPYDQVSSKIGLKKPTLLEQAKERMPVGNIFSAIGEPIMRLGSGLVAKPVSEIAGLAATAKDVLSGNIEGDPTGFKNYVQQALTYEPRTQVGASNYNPLNAVPNAIGKVISGASNLVADPIAGNEAADTPRGMAANVVRETIPQALGFIGVKKGPKAIQSLDDALAKREAAKLQQSIVNAPKQQNIIAAKEAKFQLPPSESGGGMAARALEGAVGREKLVNEMEANNASRATQIIHDDLNLPEHIPLTKGAVEEVISQSGKVYEKIKNLDQPFIADRKYTADLAVLNTKMREMSKNKTTWNPEFQDIMTDMKKSLRDPSEAVNLMKTLRADSSRNYAAAENATTAKPNVTELARFQKDSAKILEDLVHRNLEKRGMSDLSAEFLDARKTIAKGKTIQKVLDENGIVNAEKLGHLKERGAYMSEGMDQVAKFGRAFPDVAGKPKASASVPITAWEGMLGAGGAGMAMATPVGWAGLALPTARIAGRSFLQSGLGQKMIGTQKPYSPGLLSESMKTFSQLPPQAQQALLYSLSMQREQPN